VSRSPWQTAFRFVWQALVACRVSCAMLRVVIAVLTVKERMLRSGKRAEQPLFFSFFSIILYSSCIAYDKPSYLLDDFSCFTLCSRVDLLLYNPARYPDLNKPPQLLGSRPSYVPVVMTPYVSPHLSSSPIALSSSSRSSRSISHESHLSIPSGSFLPTSVLSMY
jgi:hypothetical protein